MRALLLSAPGLAITLFFTGCETTNNPVPGGTITYTIPDLPESGFLGDYSQMTLAKQPEFAVVGRKIYVNPDTDLSSYNKVIVEPVSYDYYDNAIELDAEEKERLARYLGEWLNLKLKDRFRKVQEADPKTLRVRTAITSLSAPTGIDERDSKIADIVMAIVELELSDSVTGERFLAMVDPMGGVRFTIAKEDLSEEREMYINWMDGLSADMEKQAVKANRPVLEP
jgi:hypothetical protein